MQQKITICGDRHYPPFEYVNDDGVFQGFNVELMNELGKVMGIETVFKPVLWKKAVDMIRNGKANAIQGYILLPGRNELLSFSRDYLTVSYGLFTLRDNEEIQELTDLNKRFLAIQKGDISVDLIRSITLSSDYKRYLVFTENQEEAVKLLIERKVDGIIGNQLTVSYIAEKMGLSGIIKSLGPPLAPRKYAIAVNKKDQELLDFFNQGIGKLIKNGIHSRLLRKWFGSVSLRHYNNIETFSGGIITLNSLGIINYVNNYTQSLFDIKEVDFLGEHFLETKIIDWIRSDIVQQCLLTYSFHFDLETKFNSRGRDLKIYYNVCPMYDPQTHQVSGVLINLKDIPTGTKVKQDDLHHDKMYALGRILTGLAHEMRTPLTSLKSFAQVMGERPDDKELFREFMYHVPGEIERLERLVDDILEYANPREKLPEIVSINSIIQSVVNLLQNQFRTKESIKIAMNSELKIYANEDNIKQIFFNLILNAIEALEGVGEIKIRGWKSENGVTVRIIDNGRGIPLENMVKVFEPFFSTKPQGTGLGLYITYNLLRVNNGKIALRSMAERGTEVEIIFERVVGNE